MKRLNLLTLLIIGILFTSCSNDDDNSSVIPEANKKFIKAVTKPDLTQINRDHFFEYDDGLLTSATGFTILTGNYEYDSEGKLTGKTNFDGLFTYEYDNQNRIVKEVKVGTNNYIELTYQSGKVITERYYEFAGGLGNGGGEVLEIRELELNSNGLIIKMTEISNTTTTDFSQENGFYKEYEQYEYDTNGNITSITTKYFDDPNESVLNISYDDKINPYYIAFEKYYNITYYLENFSGVIFYNWYGLTPNNIISRGTENRTFVYDEDNYPISWQRFFADGSSNAEAFVEYY